MRKPNLTEKVAQYENLFNDIGLACEMDDHEKVTALIHNIRVWRWAHRDGNGEKSDKEVEAAIREKFWNLRNWPKSGMTMHERVKADIAEKAQLAGMTVDAYNAQQEEKLREALSR